MPSKPPGPGPGSGTDSNGRILGGCCLCVLAVLVGIAGLVTHYVIESPTSPYKVEFSEPGRACDESADVPGLVLDRNTGELLSCSALPRFDTDPEHTARRPFSAAEVGRVVKRARSLASPGHLTDADRGTVKRLATDIGRRHGHTKTEQTLLERLTWTIGLASLIAGLVPLIALGIWAHYRGL